MPDTSDNNATRVQHKCGTSATRTTRVRHKCYTNDTSEKTFDFDNYGSKNMFHIPIFTIWQVKDYKERSNFILSTTFKNASFAYQNEFEKCPQKLEFLMVRAISKSYTLDCSCKSPCAYPHSCA